MAFVKANYQPELLAFRRARTLADLRKPESWYSRLRVGLEVVLASGKAYIFDWLGGSSICGQCLALFLAIFSVDSFQ